MILNNGGSVKLKLGLMVVLISVLDIVLV
jgi:hypothetical protein